MPAMKPPRTYQVNEVARLSGVSVRALHHYHSIALLVPTGRTEAGYRLYTDADLLRLQQILIRRELGFPLDDIRRALDDPHFDHRAALVEQRKHLQAKAQAVESMLRAIGAALAVVEHDSQGGSMEMKEIFDGFEPAKYEDEARDRWGTTDAYREAGQRVKQYTPEDWKRQKAEQAALLAEAATAAERGLDPASPEAMDIAERHRLAIDRWFYPCSNAMHAGLADMYEADARFAASIDAHREGLTAFLAAAMRANAARG
jgi:MerR family transcriptional regulator, thiopeptide resistance regulator